MADKPLPPEDEPLAGGLTYDPELGPGYFIQTRSDFLRAPEFSPLATRLYQVLLTYCGAGETAWPGQARLVRECGIKSVPTLRKALDELIAADLVTETRRGLNRTNFYHVHKLPLILVRDTKKLAIQKQRNAQSRSHNIRVKVESDQTDSVETDRPALRKNGARDKAAERHQLQAQIKRDRPQLAPGTIAAILAAWATDDPPDWLAWWQAHRWE